MGFLLFALTKRKICSSIEDLLLQIWIRLENSSKWILNIGNNKEGEPNDGEDVVEISDET